MIILLTHTPGLTGSTWELQRPQGVDTGTTVTYNSGTGEVSVPDGSLTPGDYWLEHTLVGENCTDVHVEQFEVFDNPDVVLSLDGNMVPGCESIRATTTNGTAPYSYQWYKTSIAPGNEVYGPTTDDLFNPTYEGTPLQTVGSTDDYYVVVTDANGCTRESAGILRTRCQYEHDMVDRNGTFTINCNGANPDFTLFIPVFTTCDNALMDIEVVVNGNTYTGGYGNECDTASVGIAIPKAEVPNGTHDFVITTTSTMGHVESTTESINVLC